MSWGTQPAWLLQDGDRGLGFAMDAIREIDRGTRVAPLGTYFIKAHFCERPGQERDVPGALHGGTIHCVERRHSSVDPRFP